MKGDAFSMVSPTNRTDYQHTTEILLVGYTMSTTYHGGQFYWWKKPEYPEKTTNLPQVIDKLYHIVEIVLNRKRGYK